MNIGAKIRLLRKEKKLTQEALAEYLHISSQAVSKWETGASSPDIDMLPKLAIFFGTSLDNLLDFDQSALDAAIEAILVEAGRGGSDVFATVTRAVSSAPAARASSRSFHPSQRNSPASRRTLRRPCSARMRRSRGFCALVIRCLMRTSAVLSP